MNHDISKTNTYNTNNNRKIGKLLLITAVFIALVSVTFVIPSVAPVHADAGPCAFLGATFTINYFSNAGLTTAWPTYATDGSGMCGPGSVPVPVVTVGQTIYVKITVSGAPINTNLWYQLDGGNSPWPSTALICNTDATGSCSGSTSITISQDMVNLTGNCMTVQEKVLFSSTTPKASDFDGNIIDHLILGNTGSTCGAGFPPASPLTASKTATPSFTRTFHWTISKSVDQTEVDIAAGGSATFTYTVTVTHDSGTDSNWQVNGMITVTNPNTAPVTGVTVTDAVDNGGTCSVTGGTGVTVPASGSVMLSYTCTYASAPSPSSGTNTATVRWSTQTLSNGQLLTGGSATGTAAFDFGTVSPTIVDGSVTVTDTLGGALGTVLYTDPSPKMFTYMHTFTGDTGGTCTNHDNTATFTTSTTMTTGTASKTVKVCVGIDLTVSKNATPSFTRTFTWGIMKSVDQTQVDIAAGGSAIFMYTVTVTHDSGTDSNWQVNGMITVSNPNDWESITANVADAVDNGGSCTVTGGTGVTIPASSFMMLSYTCTYTSAPSPSSGTNTATATVTAGITPSPSVSGSTGFTFGAPTTIVDGSVTVTDTLGGSLGTVSYTDPSPTTFTYSHTFTGDTGGTCTNHDNTATFTTSTTGTMGSASKTVKVCVGIDLTVSKTANPTFTRTYQWNVAKFCDSPSDSKTSCLLTGTGSVTIPYNVVVTNTGFQDSGWMVTGSITVTNPNNWEAITATVTDAVNNGGTCTVTSGVGVSVPASGSVSLSYTCTYLSAPSPTVGTNTATATWDKAAFFTPDGSASGTATIDFTTPTTLVNQAVTVTDSAIGNVGTVTASVDGTSVSVSNLGTGVTDTVSGTTVTFSYFRTLTLPTGGATCTTATNTATLSTGQSASTTVTGCPPGFVTNTSFCAISQNTVNLIYVQDSSSTFNLRASNPGQFYYNIFYAPSTGAGTPFTITINLPYPFITQGARPIQTSSSFSLNTNGLCISPSFDNPVTGIIATGNHFSTSGYPVVLLSDSGSIPTITVTGVVPSSGLVYITVHMDYGLKGFDFTKGVSQTYNGFTSNAAIGSNTPSAITINNGQSYLFSTAGALVSSFTLNSINTFKADPGFAGIITDQNGNPLVGVKVVINFNGKTYTLYTDNTGYYSLVDKYTGSPTSWTVTAYYGTQIKSASGTTNANKLVYNGFTFTATA